MMTIRNKVINSAYSHSNCKAHNWLAYNCVDKYLLKSVPMFKGVLFDLGCGDSPYKQFFLRYAKQYIGVDWYGSYHEEKADIIADLNIPLPIQSEVADTVVSLSVLEHLCEPQTMLKEAFRILKHGGGMALQVPWQWWIHEAPYDFYRYTPFGLKHLLEKAGFVDVVVEPQSGFFTMLILKMNYFTCRLIRGPKPLKLVIKGFLLPFWSLGQRIAPILDKMDHNWAGETSGYFVTARKP